MDIPFSVQHKASMIRRYWKKEIDQDATGPVWDPDRRAWWVLMELGDDVSCDEELHDIFGADGACDKDYHKVTIGIRFVHTKKNHGTWTDGGKCRILMDGVEVNSLEFSKVMSLMSRSRKFGSSDQTAPSQSAPSSVLDTKKNTVIRV